MKNKKNHSLVVKSNEMVEASYKLSLQEQRIILYMASMIQPDDEDFKPIKVKISDFINLVQIEGHSQYERIKEITRKLRKRELLITQENTTLQAGWLSSAKYFHQEGYVSLRFDPELKPYLLQLKERFTKYQLNHVIRLKHSYSVRFYELLKQYESIGWRFFVLEELKDILGIGADEYSLYSNFKLKVLNPVKKEFDLKYSKQELDFTFEYEEKKEGRKVAGLKFEILKPSIQPELFESVVDESKYNQHQESLYAELKALKLSKKQIVSLIEKHPLEAIQRNIELVQKKAGNKEIKNIPAFLFDAIEGDFASNQAQDYDPAYGSLISKAKSCWAKNKGGCAAVWSNYKNVKNHECHYCKKFDEQRARV